MAIEGFDYHGFSEELSSQAGGLLPEWFQDFQRNYVINTIKNFATLSGEAISNDEKANFNVDQAMFLTQIIAEWSFHKSVDIIKSGILPDYWDAVMQKVAFTIFEIAKQMIGNGVSQDEILQVVEHHVKKSYEAAITELKDRKIIDDETFDRAVNQSNIDEMMQQMQEDKQEQTIENEVRNADGQPNSKVLKLASVALLLKQVSQDKVQTILNKFNQEDAQTVIQYMQMRDLEKKVDTNIAMRCLHEIRTNLPEPKFISPEKILAKMNKVFEKANKEKLEKVIFKERPEVKSFVINALDGEYSNMPSKVANIIAQHLEESVS